MLKSVFISITLFITSSFSWAATPDIQPDNRFPQVQMETSMGTILIELDRKKAPITVDNFLTYVVNGDYNNTIFHRVIAGFVVQGGGFTQDLQEQPNNGTIVNESGNGLSNAIGTIAMARTADPHSASRQFYFNVNNNTNLDPSPRSWGYAVFGDVIEGMEVVQQISNVQTGNNATLGWSNIPLAPVILKSAKLLPTK